MEGQTNRSVDSIRSRHSMCGDCGQCGIGCFEHQNLYQNDLEIATQMLHSPKIQIALLDPIIPVIHSHYHTDNKDKIWLGEYIHALKKLGFDLVFDLGSGADLAFFEKTDELLHRLRYNHNLPMISSFCPASVYYIERHHPELIENLSTVKSPQLCLASIIKTYFAKTQGIHPEQLNVVTITTCPSRKFEARRFEHKSAYYFHQNKYDPFSIEPQNDYYDVDLVLTYQEIEKLLLAKKIYLHELPMSKFDDILGESSGLGSIFGLFGGQSEGVIRSLSHRLTEPGWLTPAYYQSLEKTGLITHQFPYLGKTFNLALTDNLSEINQLLHRIKTLQTDYHYVEISACDHSCMTGHNEMDLGLIKKWEQQLRAQDQVSTYPHAHKQPYLADLYHTFLGQAGARRSQQLLHTRYFNYA